jgi:GNAT superfamily N-acetyltransferase
VSAYRFCRTDDIGLLVDALNRCWGPHFPGEPPMTTAGFKRTIRDLQVWCSSCMVAFTGADPIGVLIGAKRSSATLIHRIAVHPDHLRQGHGRHLLDSLSSKLAILGPPRLVAEVPDTFTAASGLFEACGYAAETVLTDYVLHAGDVSADIENVEGRFPIPTTIDDLAANGLLEGYPPTCWERSVESLMARKDEIAGLAMVSDEGIEAYLLYVGDEILALRALVEDGAGRLGPLVSRIRPQGAGVVRLTKAHPAEVSPQWLGAMGFRPANHHRLYAATARSA